MSGVLTGALYKSTAGVRPMLAASLLGLAVTSGMQVYSKGFSKTLNQVIKTKEE